MVGCDGAHSTVRSQLGIDFVGKQYETHILLADVQLTRAPGETLTGVTNEKGVVLLIPFGDGWFRAIAWDRLREQAPLSEPVTLEEIRDSFGRQAVRYLFIGRCLAATRGGSRASRSAISTTSSRAKRLPAG